MYLNQKALWTPVVVDQPLNEYGDIQRTSSKSISVRRQEHVKEVIDTHGIVHTSNYIYYTYDDVKVDDLLDGFLVVQRYDMRTLQGNLRLRRLITA